MKKNKCGIFEKEGLFCKRGTKRGLVLAIFLKKSLRGTKNPKRDRLVITAKANPYTLPSLDKGLSLICDLAPHTLPSLDKGLS